MSRPADTLLADALLLPDAERADLATRLIESLDPGVDDDAESAWDAEIRDRLDDLDAGRVRPVPWREARRMILDDHDDAPGR